MSAASLVSAPRGFFLALPKNLIIAIPSMMVAGFLYGLAVDPNWLKELITPLTILMVYPMMVTLQFKKVFEGGDAKVQILTQAINFGVVPFMCYGFGLLFFAHEPYLALGLLLAGLVPTSGMTVTYTGLAKGNMAAAVKMCVIGLTIGALATPFYVKALLGSSISVELVLVFKQIAYIVFIPMAAGYLTRTLALKRLGQARFQSSVASNMPALSTIGVLGIVFIAIGLQAKAIEAHPVTLLRILVPLTLIYALNYGLCTVLGKFLLPRADAIALVFGCVMRNLSIALAIAINALGKHGEDAALVVAIGYVVQVQSAAWYVKYADAIFGPPDLPPAQAPPVRARARAAIELGKLG